MPKPSESPRQVSPIALAYEWVARIMAVSLLMLLPGVGGQWLDVRLGTKFLALLGFGFGFCSGLALLLVMLKQNPLPKTGSDSSESLTDETEHLENRGSGKR